MKLLRVSFAATLKPLIRGFATGVNPNWISYNSIIQGKCAAKNITEAERMLEEMKRKGFAPDERTCTSLFHEFCTTPSMEQKACHLLTEMFDRGFSPSLDMHNKLIRTYCISGRTVEEAVRILRGMAERGLSPDVVSYCTIISGFLIFKEWDKQLEKALKIKEEMVEKGILPDAPTYWSLIQILCDKGRLSEAFHLSQEMLRGDVSPDELTYSTLMNTFCLNGQFSKAFHLHDQMVHKGFVPDFVTTSFSRPRVTYNALIHGLCFLGRAEEALGILRGMTEMGLSPDGVSYNTVISGFCRIEELRKAYDLMREMNAKCNWWLDKDVHISLMEDLSYLDPYSSLINGYLAEGNFQVAYTFYCEMLRLGYSSDFDSYCLFMNGLCKKARTRDAKEYLLFMIYDQCFKMPSYVTYDILIENCSNNEFKSLVELVKDLRSRGLMNEAAKAHDTMLEGNYKPDGAVYNLLIFEHCRCLNVDKAYDMYKEMMHYGFAPHMFSLIALINALHYVQMYNEKSWVVENTLRSCNLKDSELRKVLNKINVKERSIYPLLEVLAEIAMDGLLLDGGKCSYASTVASFPPPLSSS